MEWRHWRMESEKHVQQWQQLVGENQCSPDREQIGVSTARLDLAIVANSNISRFSYQLS